MGSRAVPAVRHPGARGPTATGGVRRLGEARGIKDSILRARTELHAEKEAPRVTRIERQAESDDEVRSNIPPELVALFERVKRGIKASPRMSRTEAFLHYAEENPDDVLVATEDKTDALIRELEAQYSEARRSLRRPPPRRPRYTPEQLAEVPF